MARRDLRERVLQEEFRMCKRVTRDLYRHHMRTIYLELCGITKGFDPTSTQRANPIYNVNEKRRNDRDAPPPRSPLLMAAPPRARGVWPPSSVLASPSDHSNAIANRHLATSNCESTRRGAGRRGRTSVDSTNVLSACITAGAGKHQNANAAQKSCGEEIGSDARWSDGPYQDRDVEPLPLIALLIITE